jgi:O-antigen ligase
MKRAGIRILLSSYFLCLVGTLMLVEWLRAVNLDIAAFQQFRDSLLDLILSPSDQIYLVICFAAWFLTLTYVEISDQPMHGGLRFVRSLSLNDRYELLLLVCSVVVYTMGCFRATEPGTKSLLLFGIDQSTNVLVFLAGLVICQTASVFDAGDHGTGFFRRMALPFFVFFLAAISLFQGDVPHAYQYLGKTRWTGLWVNPNTCGLLMGTGIVLASGQLFDGLKLARGGRSDSETENRITGVRRGLKLVILAGAACLMALGFFKSLSRGAWIATGVGVGYIIADFGLRSAELPIVQRIKRSWLPLAVGCLSLGVVLFWQFKQTNWRPARRALSAANSADFSWRNRIAAWEGALQIVAEHPWLGAGWNRPESVYDDYYRASKVEDARAIEMNDYLMLGATLGIPALFCFGIYVWQSLFGGARRGARGARGEEKDEGRQVRSAKCGMRNDSKKNELLEKEEGEALELDWLKTTCRAGATVLAVGFWFDGGLFKLATASVFWILLELGSVAWRNGINNQGAKSPRGAGV